MSAAVSAPEMKTRLLWEVQYPFAGIVVGDAKWLVETDGCAMVAERGLDGPTPPESIAKRVEFYGEIIRRATDGRTVDLATLRAFLGDPETSRVLDCDECKGTGRRPYSSESCTCECCQCEGCDGAGKNEVMPQDRRVVVEGVQVNANLVAVALAAVSKGTTARVLVDQNDRGKMLQVSGDGWCVVVMGMVETTVGEVSPRFDLPSAEVAS